MNNTDEKPWLNFEYKVNFSERTHVDLVALVHGGAVPHPVSIGMTLDQFLKAEETLGTSTNFLELETYKLESPQYSAESVRRVNDFRAVFGGEKTKALPEATSDMGFGEMLLRIYCCRDQKGIVTLTNSTGNIYANQIGFYGFTEIEFKKTVHELGLPI